MYLPKVYEKFSGKFPEVLKDFKQLGQTCREAGPLDEKCQNLIKHFTQLLSTCYSKNGG